MEKVTLNVTGMSCVSCVNKIESALQQLKGVEKATVNLKKGLVKVKYDDSTQALNKLIDTIRHTGYEAESVN